jgi:hypothetical protein
MKPFEYWVNEFCRAFVGKCDRPALEKVMLEYATTVAMREHAAELRRRNAIQDATGQWGDSSHVAKPEYVAAQELINREAAERMKQHVRDFWKNGTHAAAFSVHPTEVKRAETYIVWNQFGPRGQNPRVIHLTLQDAIAEGERLATKEGYPMLVMQQVAVAKPVPPPAPVGPFGATCFDWQPTECGRWMHPYNNGEFIMLDFRFKRCPYCGEPRRKDGKQ